VFTTLSNIALHPIGWFLTCLTLFRSYDWSSGTYGSLSSQGSQADSAISMMERIDSAVHSRSTTPDEEPDWMVYGVQADPAGFMVRSRFQPMTFFEGVEFWGRGLFQSIVFWERRVLLSQTPFP
jgi:hypothetical protein